jgi:hypothetical protein
MQRTEESKLTKGTGVPFAEVSEQGWGIFRASTLRLRAAVMGLSGAARSSPLTKTI